MLGLPVVTLSYRLLVVSTTAIMPLVLRELAIFALLGLLLWIVRRGEHLPLSSIGWRAGGIGRALLWGLLAFGLLVAATALALGLLHLFGLHYGGDHAALAPPLWVTGLVVLRAGIVEEVFYRGYAIERLQALTNRPTAAVIAWLAFALSHYHQGVAGILVAATLGAVLTLFYLWRRNLAANITGHVLIDFIPTVLLPAIGM